MAAAAVGLGGRGEQVGVLRGVWQPNAPSLITNPRRVFKAANPGREQTETWIFSLAVISESDEAMEPVTMRAVLRRAGAAVKEVDHETAAVTAMRLGQGVTRLPATAEHPEPRFAPLALRLGFTEPRALAVDGVDLELRVRSASGPETALSTHVPVGTYQQKTALLFPFRGPGMIASGGAANGGHANRSGQFAIDALGLSPLYAPMSGAPEGTNPSYAGWGRPILAPADGVIVVARRDRPDQPKPEVSDPHYYAPEHPQGGDPGNHVVIDHGNGEFSLLAHFQQGSLTVGVGDCVTRGQSIALLGNSGDSSGPHVHHQLQDGPDWQASDALPRRFDNVSAEFLVKGTWFEAK
jgi:murein DD-endopeptidase MepM/ murein hydrolase activator NlpD